MGVLETLSILELVLESILILAVGWLIWTILHH